jgi:hypothetical protein
VTFQEIAIDEYAFFGSGAKPESARPPCVEGVTGSSAEQADGPSLSKVERLALAGKVAAPVRRAADRLARRRVALTDADGNVTGYMTGLEAQKKINEGLGIAFDVVPEKRPDVAVCADCGTPFAIRKYGVPRRRCDECRLGRCVKCGKLRGQDRPTRAKQERMCLGCYTDLHPPLPRAECQDCGAALPKYTVSNSRRRGTALRCASCAKSMCRSGLHAMIGANVRLLPNGAKRCRACLRESTNDRRKVKGR